jgi:hypothetical protein
VKFDFIPINGVCSHDRSHSCVFCSLMDMHSRDRI